MASSGVSLSKISEMLTATNSLHSRAFYRNNVIASLENLENKIWKTLIELSATSLGTLQSFTMPYSTTPYFAIIYWS